MQCTSDSGSGTTWKRDWKWKALITVVVNEEIITVEEASTALNVPDEVTIMTEVDSGYGHYDNADCDTEDAYSELNIQGSGTSASSVPYLNRRDRRVMKCTRSYGYLCVAGRTPFTAAQYNIITCTLQDIHKLVTLPTYKTLKTTIVADLIKFGSPKSSVTFLKLSELTPFPRNNFRQVLTSSDGMKDPRRWARIVFPIGMG